MIEQELLEALGQGEAKDWEFKSAKGGVPASLWETYSAMANTDGGTIVLGVREKDGQCSAENLDNPSRYKKIIFDTVNDRGKVSVNLLTDANVQSVTIQGKNVLVIRGLPPSFLDHGQPSPQTGANSPQTTGNSPQTGNALGGDTPPESDPRLREIARPAREKPKLLSELTRQIILDLCRGQFLTAAQIATLMDRDQEKTQERFLGPLAREGLLRMRYPDEPNRRDQAYTTARTENGPS